MSKKIVALMLSVLLAVGVAAVPATAGLLDMFGGVTSVASENVESEQVEVVEA